MQDAWLGLNTALQVFERYFTFITDIAKEHCDAIPGFIPAPFTVIPNFLKSACIYFSKTYVSFS